MDDTRRELIFIHLVQIEDDVVEDNGKLEQMLDESIFWILHKASRDIIKVVYLHWMQQLY